MRSFINNPKPLARRAQPFGSRNPGYLGTYEVEVLECPGADVLMMLAGWIQREQEALVA